MFVVSEMESELDWVVTNIISVGDRPIGIEIVNGYAYVTNSRYDFVTVLSY